VEFTATALIDGLTPQSVKYRVL